jgi:hypothetical protein
MLISLQEPEQNGKPEGIYHAAQIVFQVGNVTPAETTYVDTAAFGSPPLYLSVVDQAGLSVIPGFHKGTVEILGFACGDCNGDKRVTFADALYLKNYYYQTPPGSPAPLGRGDVNVDGRINFADAIYISNFLHKGGAWPCADF